MQKIAITGVAGRMGQSLICALLEENVGDLELAAAIHKPGSPLIGKDVGEVTGGGMTGVFVDADLSNAQFDCLIDFSGVDCALSNLEQCRQKGASMVLGTTGFSPEQLEQIDELAKDIPLVFAANMSIGMNTCFYLAQQMAKSLGPDADIEIIETHHRNKIDAPSGTALALGEIVAGALDRELSSDAIYTREGSGGVRDKRQIGFASIRGGDVVGDHTLLFACQGERVELTHKASSRETFTRGAIRAARWLADKDTGKYDMQDVLGLRA